MTQEELKKAIGTMVENPESAAVTAKDVLSEIDSIYDSIDAFKVEKEKSEKKIRDLQDTNLKLFLSQTGNVKEEDEKEITLEDLAKELSKGREIK